MAIFCCLAEYYGMQSIHNERGSSEGLRLVAGNLLLLALELAGQALLGGACSVEDELTATFLHKAKALRTATLAPLQTGENVTVFGV